MRNSTQVFHCIADNLRPAIIVTREVKNHISNEPSVHFNLANMLGRQKIEFVVRNSLQNFTTIRQRRRWRGFRDGPLENYGWEAGVENFRAARIFFVIKSLVWIFLGHSMNIFLGLTGVHEFFSFNFTLREDYLCTSLAAPPPLPPISFLMGRPFRPLFPVEAPC